MRHGRRIFLRSLAALAAGGASLRARLAGAQSAAAPAAKWGMSWRDRLSGTYRAVFDSPEVSDGEAFWRAAAWKDEVVEVYAAKPDEVHAIVVVRHRAIPMIMDDEFWDRHEIGKKEKIKDPVTNKAANRNPFRSAKDQAAAPADARGDDR